MVLRDHQATQDGQYEQFEADEVADLGTEQRRWRKSDETVGLVHPSREKTYDRERKVPTEPPCM